MKYQYFNVTNSYGKTIRGVINTPEKAGRYKTLINFHGFTGNSVGKAYIHRYLSEYLCERGFQTVRFDFSNSGDSDGTFENLNLTEEIDDAKCVVDFIKTLEATDQIYLSGHSMGGLVLAMVAKIVQPKKAFFLAPAMHMKETTLKRYQAFHQHYPNEKYMNIKGLRLKKSFIDDLQQYDALETVRGFSSPSVIFWGTKDESVPEKSCLQLRKVLEQAELVTFEGADHNFSDFRVRERIFQKIADEMEY